MVPITEPRGKATKAEAKVPPTTIINPGALMKVPMEPPMRIDPMVSPIPARIPTMVPRSTLNSLVPTCCPNPSYR